MCAYVHVYLYGVCKSVGVLIYVFVLIPAVPSQF